MLHACSGIAICVITLGNANMLDTTYAYSCSWLEHLIQHFVQPALQHAWQAMLSNAIHCLFSPNI